MMMKIKQSMSIYVDHCFILIYTALLSSNKNYNFLSLFSCKFIHHSHKYTIHEDYRFPNLLLYSFSIYYFFKSKNFLSIFRFSLCSLFVPGSIDEFLTVVTPKHFFPSYHLYIKGHIYVFHLIQSNFLRHLFFRNTSTNI